MLDRDRQFAEVQALAHVGSWELEPTSLPAIWSDELCRIFAPTASSASFTPLRHRRPGADGSAEIMFGTVHDVTDRQRAEGALLEAQELFETAFTQAPRRPWRDGRDGRAGSGAHRRLIPPRAARAG